jgi:hypothetical protein
MIIKSLDPQMNMNLSEPVPNIVHLNFPTRYDLTSTFIRFQEHYESPEFRGKVFSLDEYKEWYVANSKKGKETGEFTYFEDWSGFNIPSEVLDPFYNGDFDPLDEKEFAVLDLFRSRKERSTLFYVIGTFGEDSASTLKHEIAHGLFFTNSDYRSIALEIVNEIPNSVRSQVREYLASSGGYHPDVFDDETHAYTLTGRDRLQKSGIDVSKLEVAAVNLESNFRRFSNGWSADIQ